MDVVKILIGVILPYLTIAVLVIGLAARIARWRKAPQGKMTLFPGAQAGMPMWKKIASEVLIFKSLFEGNKGLWAGSWIFHGMLALIICGHSRVVFEALFFLPKSGQDLVSGLTGSAFGLVLLITGIYLLIRRIAVQSVREISDLEDFFALFLILAIVLSGDAMRVMAYMGDHHDLLRGDPGTRMYFQALFTGQFGVALKAMPMDASFLVHFLLGQVLFIYMPFSKFLHIPGVFFSQAALQKV
jgi:nitrate reductase gamma subunit